jgi:hypothetical protein
MANNVRNDRFGNPTILRMAKQVYNRKTGAYVDAWKTYLEVGSKLIKVEIVHSNKDDKNGNKGYWVKFTEVKKNQSQGSNRF